MRENRREFFRVEFEPLMEGEASGEKEIVKVAFGKESSGPGKRGLFMNIQTARFGEMEVDENRLITFAKGIPGFEEDKRYVLLPADEQGETPFFFLQSVERAELSLLLLDSFSFFEGYDVELGDSLIGKLEIKKPEDVLVLTTVTAKGGLKEATTNLKAPIVINHSKRLGMQVVLENKSYMVKQPLFLHQQKAAIGQV
jgi:flagellar assembly factor FliW